MILAPLLVLLQLSAAPSADEHLLAGAERFRTAHYAEALVEFEVAERLGAPDAAWYAAAAKVKLGDYEGAIAAFAEAEKASPGNDDPLLDYYRAVACYQLKLYLSADAQLASAQSRVGPKLEAAVQKLRGEIASLFTLAPAPATVDWYLDHSKDALGRGNPALAEAYATEAKALAQKRQDHHGLQEANAALDTLAHRVTAQVHP